MTVDSNGYCYSEVKDYKPTVGYQVGVGYNYKYGTTTEVYTSTSDSTPIVETAYERYETATTYHTDTYTHSLHGAEKTLYHAYSYAPMITMLHHESDLQSASASGAASAVADAATTSNGAARIFGASIWGGIGSVVGIWAAGAALGAVMILPW